MDQRQRLIESLTKLEARTRGKTKTFPPDGPNCCPACGNDITFQLLGLYVKEHFGMILEALRRMD